MSLVSTTLDVYDINDRIEFLIFRYRPLTKENGYRPILGIKYKTVKPGYIKIGDPVYVIQ